MSKNNLEAGGHGANIGVNEFFSGGPGSMRGGECGVREGRLEKLWDLCLRAVQSNCNVQPVGRKGDVVCRTFSPCVLQACGRLVQLLHCSVGWQADNRLQATPEHCWYMPCIEHVHPRTFGGWPVMFRWRKERVGWELLWCIH